VTTAHARHEHDTGPPGAAVAERVPRTARPAGQAQAGAPGSLGLPSVLHLQRTAGNAAVGELIAQLQDDQGAGAVAAPAAAKDDEGNEVSGDGGRLHLTKVPPDVGWHKGKPEALPPNPKATFASLHGQVEQVAAQQLDYANSMKAGDEVTDMKYWFAKVYHFVTTRELQAIDSGTYQYPLMKMQEVIGFQATYAHNIDAWREGRKDEVESNWKAAFAEAEAASSGSFWGWAQQIVTLGGTSQRAMEVMHAMLPSMEAHIRFDLPRAIAAAFEASYQGLPGISLDDFHRDFDGMAPVFEAAQNDLLPEIDAYCDADIRPDPGGWHWMQGLGFPFIFNIPAERLQAWEKAAAIVGGHQQGIKDPAAMQERLKAYMTAAHPFSSSDAFSIEGTDITDYDWSAQPQPASPPVGDFPPPPAPGGGQYG
jgi:Family of unknown function (DUF5995)